mgnify:CR=1 FL=1
MEKSIRSGLTAEIVFCQRAARAEDDFSIVRLGNCTVQDYVLYRAAKGIFSGTLGATSEELADPELVNDDTLLLIVGRQKLIVLALAEAVQPPGEVVQLIRVDCRAFQSVENGILSDNAAGCFCLPMPDQQLQRMTERAGLEAQNIPLKVALDELPEKAADALDLEGLTLDDLIPPQSGRRG